MKIENDKLAPGLYLTPTPIGNMDDITLRAIKVLQKADVIACEDTRRTGQLLMALNIPAGKRLESYNDINEKTKSPVLISEVASGRSLALTTDAGSPGISDPGYRLVRTAIDAGIPVIPLPGPTAFVPALTASGLAVNDFRFFGFPPRKKGRATFFETLKVLDCTSILYESPFRAVKLAEDIVEYCGAERKVCFAREISKIFEEFIRGTADEVLTALKAKTAVKGEFTVIIEGVKCL